LVIVSSDERSRLSPKSLGAQSAVQQHVERLEVAVDDDWLPAVQVGERLGDVRGDCQLLLGPRQLLLVLGIQQYRQVALLHELGHDAQVAHAVPGEAHEPDDVGVLKSSRKTHFVGEQHHVALVVTLFGQELLDSHNL
jgi:hypothetical protein